MDGIRNRLAKALLAAVVFCPASLLVGMEMISCKQVCAFNRPTTLPKHHRRKERFGQTVTNSIHKIFRLKYVRRASTAKEISVSWWSSTVGVQMIESSSAIAIVLRPIVITAAKSCCHKG